jgi:hypothetical protein
MLYLLSAVTIFLISILLDPSEPVMNIKEVAEADTPRTGEKWRAAVPAERESWVHEVLARNSKFAHLLEVVDLRDDGQIILRFKLPVSSNERGELLLDFELALKSTIDPALTIWLEPLGDKSSLRRLRGIKVKS